MTIRVNPESRPRLRAWARWFRGAASRLLLPGIVMLMAGVSVTAIEAQVPGEVPSLQVYAASNLAWNPVGGAAHYNVYRGTLSALRSGVPLRCHGYGVGATSFDSLQDPPAGNGFAYVVTAEAAAGEGSAGQTVPAGERALLGRCRGVMRNHVLDRAGFGWDEWSRDRIEALDIQGFIDEQLTPESIDETDNTVLADRLLGIEPPATVQNLQAVDLVRAVYSRRQLEQQLALFWANHFNTEYLESYKFFRSYRDDIDRRRLEAITLHHDELEQFRFRAFNGNFREILEDCALSRAMIIYLDTDNNVAGKPNENHARELLELHAMGVDGGYTHHEIDALARVLTGWNVCKKESGDIDDVVAPCIASPLIGTVDEPEGEWVINFRADKHDCEEKNFFSGTADEAVIPYTCDSPEDGKEDVILALDAIAAHPSTAAFISRKLLKKFVTDEPTQQMVDEIVTVWNDETQPYGAGDLREVQRAVLAQTAFLDPDGIGRKIKTPFEHVASAFRATRGKTNGTSQVRSYLKRMQNLLHQNPIPTGYPETGGEWLDSNGVLERQNFGMDLAGRTGTNFGTDLIGLLQDNDIATTQGHAEEIVDFFIDALFGGALAPAERQAAVDYLASDDLGVASNYNNPRIRETVGLLLGFAQFLEQ